MRLRARFVKTMLERISAVHGVLVAGTTQATFPGPETFGSCKTLSNEL
jgi:hypothetical protein